MLSSREAFLTLVRLGIGHSGVALLDNPDWSEIGRIASRQGLLAVIADGVELLPSENRPPQEILVPWIGRTLQTFENRYKLYERNIAELAAFYNSHGYKMMVLKGYACSLNWPKPEHRPCGDIDIWLFGHQKEADAILSRENSVKIDSSHQHHTVFKWGRFVVENHYDFDNIHARRSNARIEVLFKDLARDDSRIVELHGEHFCIPSPNLHALFLVRHAAAHFVGSSITLRQLLDWAFFAKKHEDEIDWNWLRTVIGEYYMTDFFNIINAICVEDLGFESTIFRGGQYNPLLKDRVLADIVSLSQGAPLPKLFIPRVVYRFNRWRAHKWKHNLCYQESMWSTFWSGVKNHLMKPSSL